MSRIVIKDTGDLQRAAREFLSLLGDRKRVAFFAPMGAGKTTFITALCKVLGVSDPVCSPTFTIINEYLTPEGESIYHFDFYRLTKISEAYDIGVEDYFYSGNLCLMEWPQNIEEILPEDTLRVEIHIMEDFSRVLEF